jgi:hypothetical protein
MCKAKCSCNYRIKEVTIDGQKVYYPEYSKRLFPWKWKRLDLHILSDKKTLLYFKNRKAAEDWLVEYKNIAEPLLSNRVYKL